MSFLDLFKKKPQAPSINCRVWLNQVAKEKACIRMAKTDHELIFIAWSRLTFGVFQNVFSRQGLPSEVILAREVIPSRLEGKEFVFLERHYDRDKELNFLESINANKVLVQFSLEDPIMSAFNSDRVLKVMESMGHQEDEPMEHKMINKSIERGMDKVKDASLTDDLPEVVKVWIDSMD